jgi:hypothetical protein
VRRRPSAADATIGGRRNGDQVTTCDSFVGDVDDVTITTG